MDLLFDLVTWLSYAKLRQHTDSTLESFDKVTTSLGYQLRKFARTTCPRFRTKETPKEKEARERRAIAKRAKEVAAAAAAGLPPPAEKPKKSASEKWKTFSLRTYKLHALGDYLKSIRLFGTSDSYSTQIVSHLFIFIAN
jgi:hypothetical protein